MAHEQYSHQAVLLEEVLEALNVQPSGVYIDLTYGRGGHARAILQQLGDQGRLIAMDKDPAAIRDASNKYEADQRVTVQQGSSAMCKQVINTHDLLAKVNGVLLDLGVSSPQLDDPCRGFSFKQDGPLDMRMNPELGISAAQWLVTANEKEIATVLREYGEERYAKRIASAIVAARQDSPIQTTGQLAAIVAAANPAWEKGKDPATRTFLAIRIFINHELDDLQTSLEQAVDVLADNGRLVVISFHSLEDRIVKRFIRRQAKGDDIPVQVPIQDSQRNARLKPIGKAIFPKVNEISANPRARSAVMRVAEKIH